MVRRLLWKELREGWMFALTAVLMPTVTFKFASVLEPGEREILQFIGAIASPMAIMLWAALKGERLRNEGKLPLAHIPVPPVLERTISLGLPLLVSALAGAWLGRTVYHVYHVTNAFTAIGLFALYEAFVFAACCLIAAAVSTWTGVALGLICVVFGMICMSNFTRGHGLESYLAEVSSASIVSLVLFLLLSHKRRFRFAWAPPILLLATLIVAPIVYDNAKLPAGYEPYYGRTVISQDGVFTTGLAGYERGRSTLFRTDKRVGTQSVKSFDGVATPVALDDLGRAYVIQSLDKRRIRLIRWDGRKTRQIADIPCPRILLDHSYQYWAQFGSVSPDRRYVLFTTASLLGSGTDCWLVDMRSGRACIAIPNQDTAITQATWLKGRVVLSASALGLRSVSLRTSKPKPLRIPGWDGG